MGEGLLSEPLVALSVLGFGLCCSHNVENPGSQKSQVINGKKSFSA